VRLSSRERSSASLRLRSRRWIFSAHGYELASVAQIANEAGVSKGALYVHFESKEALFRELLLEHVRRRCAATAAQLGPEVPLREGVRRIIQGAWAIHDGDSPGSSLSTEFFALAVRNDWGRAAMASIFEHCSAALVYFLERAQERGEVRDDLDCLTAARMMLALQDGLVLQWQSQPEDAAPSRLLTPMAEMILSYIEPRKGAS